MIVDSTFVTQAPIIGAIDIPFTRLAKEKIGIIVVANVIALGAISAVTSVVTYNSLKAAVLNRAPKGTEENNEKALKLGYDEAKKWLKKNTSEKQTRDKKGLDFNSDIL